MHGDLLAHYQQAISWVVNLEDLHSLLEFVAHMFNSYVIEQLINIILKYSKAPMWLCSYANLCSAPSRILQTTIARFPTVNGITTKSCCTILW